MEFHLKSRVFEGSRKCSVCGSRIHEGEEAYTFRYDVNGSERQAFLHQECSVKSIYGAIWSYFWHKESGTIVRIVVFPESSGGWGVYSQTSGRPIVKWGREFETRYQARTFVQENQEFMRVKDWRCCRPKPVHAA